MTSPIASTPIDYERRYSEEEYLALEEQLDYRIEWFDGQIVPKHGYETDARGRVLGMAGASQRHNILTSNIQFAFRTRLKGRKCRALAQDLKLQTATANTYPDVLVSCDPADLKAEQRWRHPVVIVEVMSSSTLHRDREWKWERYRQLPSLRQYVLVSQYRVWVESYTRAEENAPWINEVYTDLAATLPVPALGLQVPLAELYDDIDLSPLRVV